MNIWNIYQLKKHCKVKIQLVIEILILTIFGRNEILKANYSNEIKTNMFII